MKKFIVDHFIELGKNRLLISMTLPFLVWIASWFSEGLASAMGFSAAMYVIYSAFKAFQKTMEQ